MLAYGRASEYDHQPLIFETLAELDGDLAGCLLVEWFILLLWSSPRYLFFSMVQWPSLVKSFRRHCCNSGIVGK
jgi:hypothetical protein